MSGWVWDDKRGRFTPAASVALAGWIIGGFLALFLGGELLDAAWLWLPGCWLGGLIGWFVGKSRSAKKK